MALKSDMNSSLVASLRTSIALLLLCWRCALCFHHSPVFALTISSSSALNSAMVAERRMPPLITALAAYMRMSYASIGRILRPGMASSVARIFSRAFFSG